MDKLLVVSLILTLLSVTWQGDVRNLDAQAQLDLTRLPIGDGRLSHEPEVGSVWACANQFGGGGAFAVGPWIHDDGTYDLTSKVAVQGEVEWPHELAALRLLESRLIRTNGLPDHATGQFPIDRADPAFRYDTNPNGILPQDFSYTLSAAPIVAEQPSCVPQGPIGILLSGSAFFNALDAQGHDAVAHEIQDRCQGHPERTGVYHYHSLTSCLADMGTGHSDLMGYAFDGFGLFGNRGEDGSILTSADLDACHGHTHTITWDGEEVEMYHYHATPDYPYTLGCFQGTPARQPR